MPIPRALKKFYGHKWRTVHRPAILKRAGGVFDEAGRYIGGARCMRCGVPDVMPLSVYQHSLIECAHLDCNSADSSEENTAALCHKCHRAADYQVWIKKFKAWVLRQRELRKDRLDASRPLVQAIRWELEVEVIMLQVADFVPVQEAR